VTKLCLQGFMPLGSTAKRALTYFSVQKGAYRFYWDQLWLGSTDQHVEY